MEVGYDNPYFGLLWDPGLGKTATVLHLAKELGAAGEIESVLVVATKRIAEKVWVDEIKKWGLPFRHAKVMGTPKKRAAALQEEAEFYLTNFENLEWLCDNWQLNNFGNVMLVVDESTKMKNTQAKRSKALRKKLDLFCRRCILTGTPIPNGMEDLFGQMLVVDRGERLGQYITQYRNRYFYPTGYKGYHYKLLPGAKDDIYEAVEDIIHRASDEVLDLPPLVVVDRKVTLSDDAWEKYAELEEEFFLQLDEGIIRAGNAAALSAKLRQVANGTVYRQSENPEEDILDLVSNRKREVDVLHTEKVSELVELLEEIQGVPTLIAYEFTHDRVAIEKAILGSRYLPKDALPKNKFGKRYVPYIGSGVPDKLANEHIDNWNAGKYPYLLGHPKSVAHGLNMQELRANVCYFALSYSLEDYEQFYKRVYRKGQAHTVYLYRIICEDTIDEAIIATVEKKDAEQKDLLHNLRERTKNRFRR